MDKTREYWLDGFEGPVKSWAFYRSRIHLDIDDFETKFNQKLVSIKVDTDYETDKPSWTIEFLTEMTIEEAEKALEREVEHGN